MIQDLGDEAKRKTVVAPLEKLYDNWSLPVSVAKESNPPGDVQ